MTNQHLHISPQRLYDEIERFGRFGATPDGGVSRPVFSPPDCEARRAFGDACRALGLDVRLDAAANVFASRRGSRPDLPAILLGSHLDSVPGGGRFDGPLGVLCGLEVMRALTERGQTTRRTVTLAALTGEEATSFGTSTFGSRALAGRLPDVSANLLPDGRSVRDALADAGGDWESIAEARADLGPLRCFLEVHLEQGTRLERAGAPLAAVSGVCGIYRQRIMLRGMAAHAGTTAMGERRDALRAAARLVLAAPGLAARCGDPAATATVGHLTVEPNSPNVIPGVVTLVTDLRSADATVLAALARDVAAAAEHAAREEGIEVAVDVMLDQAPVAFDPMVIATLRSVAAQLGPAPAPLPSLAGHDAVHLQSLAPAGMIFVRCAEGLSHCPAEYVSPQDAGLAAEALYRAVLALDG